MVVRHRGSSLWCRSSGISESRRVAHISEWERAPATVLADAVKYTVMMKTAPISLRNILLLGTHANSAALRTALLSGAILPETSEHHRPCQVDMEQVRMMTTGCKSTLSRRARENQKGTRTRNTNNTSNTEFNTCKNCGRTGHRVKYCWIPGGGAFDNSNNNSNKRKARTTRKAKANISKHTRLLGVRCVAFVSSHQFCTFWSQVHGKHDSAARRRRERRLRQWLRHERLNVAMESDHHAAPRGQKKARGGASRTTRRSGRAPLPSRSSLICRSIRLVGVRLVQQHTVEQIADAAPLDALVPLMVEQLVDVLQLAEQWACIFSSRKLTFQFLVVVGDSQVFKVFTQNRVQQHRCLPSRSLTFRFPVEVFKVFAQDNVQLHHPHHLTLVLEDADEPFEGFFRTFPRPPKSARVSPRTRVRSWVRTQAHPRSSNGSGHFGEP